MDFMSSGHAKDEHSLNRFGFKFGLRPSYSGKIDYNKSDLEEVISRFGSKEMFEQYIYVLKQMVVVASTMAENMLIQKETNDEQNLVGYLDGKIFQQGFEEPLSNVNSLELKKEIIHNFLRKEHKDKFNSIAKEIYLKHYDLE